MKKFVRVIALAAASVMLFSAAGCSQQAQPEAGAETEGQEPASQEPAGGTIVMATNAEFPPYEYREEQTIKGIDVDIMNMVADKLGMELEIEDMAFDSIIPAVKSGKADIGVAGMTVTEERLVNVDFTDTYIKASQVIIKRTDDDTITDADSLSGKVIGVQLGTTGDLYVSDIEGADVQRFAKGFEAVQALQQSKIDAVVIDDQVAVALAEGNEGVIVLEEPFTEEEYAICVNKGNTELLDKLNSALGELKESGELQKIIDKYIAAE